MCTSKWNFFSDLFNYCRRCRQGDPISPYLFNICVEIVGNIRQRRPFIGIHKHIFFQYANNTIMFLDGTKEEKSLKAALDFF